jgi:DNA-binding transcriptional LysR family regulator
VWHLRDLGYFVAVAEHRNFTRAAEELFVSQPTLSKQIAALERSLNTPLFHREHDGARLTHAGEALLPFARTILASASEAEIAVSAAIAELTIGFWLSPGNGLLPAALGRFAKMFPDANVALRRADWSEPWAGVEARRADLAVFWWPAGCKALNLRQIPLAPEQPLLAMSATHPLTSRDEIWPDDLRDEVILDAPPEWRRSLDCAPVPNRLGRAVRVVRTIDETIECIVSGLGVIEVPASLMPAHMPPSVVARPLRGVPALELAAVWRHDDENLPQLRSLIQCLVQACRTMLS